jgi:hypothetical protein
MGRAVLPCWQSEKRPARASGGGAERAPRRREPTIDRLPTRVGPAFTACVRKVARFLLSPLHDAHARAAPRRATPLNESSIGVAYTRATADARRWSFFANSREPRKNRRMA